MSDVRLLKNKHQTWNEAVQKSNEWHQELADRLNTKANLTKSLEGTEFVMDLSGGLKAYRLRTRGALDYESDHMGHCVGRGGYDQGVENGTIEIYSIRDEKGEPHATFEVKYGQIEQSKGKKNTPPVKKYWPAVREFVEKQKFDFSGNADMMSMGFFYQDGKIYNVYNRFPNTSIYFSDDAKGIAPLILSTIEVKKYSNPSKKIEMIDTPGANCTNVGLEDLILNVNKLINKEENKNIVILYCKKYEYSEYIRFRETEVNLIEKIMNIYHKQNNDLPVIITILQTLHINNKEELGKIEELILTTFKNNLKDKNNLKNIRIKFVVARRLDIIGNTAEKSGMKELLETAFDMKIETIISERLAKYNHKMNIFYENFVIEKFEKIDEIINDEIQIIKKALIEGANYFNFYTNDNITNNANKKNKIINIIDDDY